MLPVVSTRLLVLLLLLLLGPGCSSAPPNDEGEPEPVAAAQEGQSGSDAASTAARIAVFTLTLAPCLVLDLPITLLGRGDAGFFPITRALFRFLVDPPRLTPGARKRLRKRRKKRIS